MDKKTKEYFTNNLKRIINGQNLDRSETKKCLIHLLDHDLGVANNVCFGAFFAALQTKEPTVDEVVGLMNAVIEYDRIPVDIERNFQTPLCGIIGSGKDDLKTFNVSSISAIIAAAAGVKVIKNGSRAEASVAGTTDVFEALGANVLIRDQSVLNKSISSISFAFCDAEPYFPKMVKEYLGKFYFVHPLSYILPVASGVQFDRVVFGLAKDETELTAELLLKLGYDNSLVVAGHDSSGQNFDEISNIGPTKITEIKNGKISTYFISPEDLGIATAHYEDIKEGQSVQENTKIFRDVISGADRSPKRDIVLMNAGALIYISGSASSIQEGIKLAGRTIDSGKAEKVLDSFVQIFK
jgi:anthranilate phosphoribosyltransferase